MEQIQNINQLLTEAIKKEGNDKKIEYLMNYFFNTVNYDYAYLFACGYAQWTISMVDEKFSLKKKELNNKQISEIVLSRGILKGESLIFDDIIQLQKNSQGDFDLFINNLKKYVTNELKKHINNEKIISENVNKFIEQIKNDLLYKKLDVSVDNLKCSLNYDISSILIEFLLNADKIFPPIMENGLIKNGVCKHYSNYLLALMEKLGIEAHKLEGTSELSHAWIIAKGDNNYKSIDLTRAIFIRDGFLGIPDTQKASDWLYCDINKIFDMQKTRTITKIDDNVLANPITSENYSESEFLEIINNCSKIKKIDNKDSSCEER